MVHKGSQAGTEASRQTKTGRNAGKLAEKPAGRQRTTKSQTSEKNYPPQHKQNTKSKEHKTPNCFTWNNGEHHNRTMTNVKVIHRQKTLTWNLSQLT
ncbi:hypothetical protein, partial [Thiolapillus sp.]|uniref:hypothetical protein n=1 Tax=Thiolapillus sp. TaxID=2017437 RepID=UPI003AF55E41